MEVALNHTTFSTQAQALFGKAISEHTTQRKAEVKEYHQQTPLSGA